MTDINLNPQLTARLRAAQQYWGHDNIAETTALILDAVINKWDIQIPNTPHIVVDKPSRVRLKARHTAYFTQMSQLSGMGIAELVRSVLIQWLCLPKNTLLLPENNIATPENRPSTPKLTQKQPKKHTKRVKEVQEPTNQDVEPPENNIAIPENRQPSTDNTQPSPKTTGRAALSGLLSKK